MATTSSMWVRFGPLKRILNIRALPITIPLCIVAGLLMMLIIIPTQFFLAQLEFDPLQYYLMADHVARTGNAAARFAENMPAFVYPMGMGYAYAPIMIAFDNFEERIRAIQSLNVVLMGLLCSLAIRYFRVALPSVNTTVLEVLFGIGMLINIRWQHVAMMPNADVVPAILTVSASLIACDAKWSVPRKFAAITALAVIGIFIKISLAALPVAFVLSLLSTRGIRSNRHLVAYGAATIFVVGVGVAADWSVVAASIHVLAYHPNYAVVTATPAHATHHLLLGLTNLWFSALPSTLLPNFSYLITERGSHAVGFFPQHFSILLLSGMIVGSAVSAAMIVGAVKLYRTRPFDVFLFLLSVSVFALVTNSTERYLLVFSPFLWGCAVIALLPLRRWFIANRRALYFSVAVGMGFLLAAQARMLHTRLHNAGDPRTVTSVSYVKAVASAYGGVLAELRQMPKENTRLVWWTSTVGPTMQWSAVSGIPAFDIGTGFPDWARSRRVLLVLSCREPGCTNYDKLPSQGALQIHRSCFGLKLLRAWHNNAAMTEIDLLEATPSCTPQTE